MEKKIIIVGCGISGASLANMLANKGWKVTIYEKQNFIGGNCYDSYDKNGILIHNFGPHIFHTSCDDVYKFISQFTTLNTYVNKVLVNVDNKIFPLPINFKSIEIIMGDKANEVIDKLKSSFPNKKTITIYELMNINHPLVKQFLYYILKNVYFNYSAKMWGMKFEDIDSNTISRVKIALNYEHNYFPDDKYQGLPMNSYTGMIKKMLNHHNIKLILNTDALKIMDFSGKTILLNNKQVNEPVVYCGPLDEAINYKYGVLPYRSLDIKFQQYNKNIIQKAAIINYPADKEITRITEYKLMTFQNKKGCTTISKEYPGQFDLKSKRWNVRYYPIINAETKALHNKYIRYFKKFRNFFPLGRLSQYKYYDMDDAIKQSFNLFKELNK